MWKQLLANQRRLMVTLLAWTALFCSGCVGTGINQPPQLSLADVGLVSVGLFEQRLALSLRVQNPNGSEMEIRGLNCTLDFNGERFAQGGSSQRVTVPAYGDTLLKVNANVGTGSVLRQLQTLATGGRQSIDYHLQGQVEVTGLGQVPFDQTGDIPLPSLLNTAPPPGRSL